MIIGLMVQSPPTTSFSASVEVFISTVGQQEFNLRIQYLLVAFNEKYFTRLFEVHVLQKTPLRYDKYLSKAIFGFFDRLYIDEKV